MGQKSGEGLLCECCTRCEANLTLQKGFDASLKYWICKSCGQMLVNPDVEDDIVWLCDECEAYLNDQPGFSELYGEWKCTKCGHVNKIDESEIYLSEDEYLAEKENPYRGLSDAEVLELNTYTEVEIMPDNDKVFLVRHQETGELYIKKHLYEYNKSIYSYLCEHPISNMPRIIKIFESSNCLIVIEEYIPGATLADILEKGAIKEKYAIYMARSVCMILDQLHTLEKPIVHRDVKPSNIIVNEDGEVFLLDMNVARFYDAEKSDDTKYLGTLHYAAPEQIGYGLSASSPKSDIYAIGILLNVMITWHFPKEKRASGKIWNIIEKCIRLEADERYTASELIAALDNIQ